MDYNATKLLLETGKELAEKIVCTERDPKHVYHIRRADGQLQKMVCDPFPEKHTAMSLQAIVEVAANAPPYDDKYPEIWYSRHGVYTRYSSQNDGVLRNLMTLPVQCSTQFKLLKELEEKKTPLSQVQILRTLRISFRGCLGGSTICDILKRVKFNASDTSDTSIATGKVSIGKTLEREVTGTGTLPESITVYVPVFEQPTCFSMGNRFIQPVECVLEPDAATATFQLYPFPGQLEKAICFAEQAIGEMIADQIEAAGWKDKVAIYFGKPDLG